MNAAARRSSDDLAYRMARSLLVDLYREGDERPRERNALRERLARAVLSLAIHVIDARRSGNTPEARRRSLEIALADADEIRERIVGGLRAGQLDASEADTLLDLVDQTTLALHRAADDTARELES